MVNLPINTLEGPLDVLREQEVNLLTDIAAALAEMGDGAAEDRQRLLDVANDMRESFFLVAVIGEFNAGKSSFVNALIGDELLPIGITPTTEAIELIRYNESIRRTPIMRSDSLREWAHPNTGAPGVAIVDTPGTGSVFQRHETTAKSFLHRSDLVIFVISAKRAFAETERLYLEMAKNFGKKIIIVINQVDLLDPAERTQVRRFIEQQVKELLEINTLIFMVSAKESLTTRNDPNPQGGIDAVRAHLRGVFSEAPPAKQKLLSQLNLALSIVQRYHKTMQEKVRLVTDDTAKVREVKAELEQQSSGLDGQLKAARAEVDQVFHGIRERGINFIDNHLSIKLIGRPPSKEQLQSEFQDVVIGRALRDINEATSEYVNALVDHSRMYWRGVIDRLKQLRELIDQETSGLDAGVYAEQREGLQEAIRIAETELRTYSRGEVINQIRANFEENLNGFRSSMLAAFGGLLVMIVAVATPGPLVGAAAAPLALPALIVAAPFAAIGGVATVRYFRRISRETKEDFNTRVDHLEKTYHEALDDLTQKERSRLAQYGTQVLTPIFSRLETMTQRYTEQRDNLQQQLDRIEALRKSIEDQK